QYDDVSSSSDRSVCAVHQEERTAEVVDFAPEPKFNLAWRQFWRFAGGRVLRRRKQDAGRIWLRRLDRQVASRRHDRALQLGRKETAPEKLRARRFRQFARIEWASG